MSKKKYTSRPVPKTNETSSQASVDLNHSSHSFLLPNWQVFAGLLVIIYLSYAKIWSNGFVWDDDPYIILNESVKNFDLYALLTGFHVGNYHPLTMLTLAVEYALVGDKPWLYHFNNLWLHAVNSLLVFLLIKRLTKRDWVALFTAVFFAIHPLHVESVAWAAERKDVLYTLFLLLSFLWYLDYQEDKNRKAYLVSIALFLLACFSKGMAVVLPALLLITDWWFLGKSLTLKNLLDKIPYFIITLIFAFIATTAQKDAGADASTVIGAAYTGSERFRIVAYSFLFYWVKTLAPTNLIPFYPYPARVGGSIPGIYNLAVIGLFAFLALSFWFGRKNRKIWWAVAFFIIAISTVLQILPVGSAIVADRYYYLSSIGPLFLIALFLDYLIQKSQAGMYLGVLLIGGCGLLTFQQVGHWKNLYTLFTPAEKVYKEDAMVLSNLGWYYLGEKNFPMAKQYLMRADNNGFKNADVCRTIASMFIDEGQFEQAIPYIQRAFDYLPKKSRTDWLMAMALNKLGRDKEALPYASRAYESEPENTDYRSTYAAVLAGSGDGAEARKFFEQMGAEGGNSPDIKLNYAYSFRTEGNLEKEIELLKQLIQEHPDYLPAYKNIGVSLGELGRNDETVAYWMKAAELDSSGDYEYNIGINFANRNLIQAAIPWYQKAAKKGKKEAIDLLTQNGVSW